MKRTVFSAALLLAALSLTFCQKAQIESDPKTEVPFSIVASYSAPQETPASKTVNSGLDTKWEEGDALNLFHAAAGSSSYVKDGEFTVSDVTAGTFSGVLSEKLSEGSYDWYALYPYSSSVDSPAATDKYISVASASQTQSGNDSKAHLSGETFPLFAAAKAVASSQTPVFAMSQINSVVKLHVTNSSSAPLTVTTVSFTAPEEIAGEFALNFTGSALSFSPKASAVSSTVTLEVSGGEAIAVGESADFYLALKPFTASTGSSLKFSVNGVESEKQLTKDVVFTAGNIKPVNFSYKQSSEPEISINQKYASENGYECAVNEKTLSLETTLPDGYSASQISWSSSDVTIATVSDGVVTYAGGFGEVTITAAIDGLKSGSITLNVPCGLIRETFHNSAHYSFDHAKQSGNSTSTSSVWHDGCVVTYAGGFGEVTITAAIDGLKSGSITLNVPCGLIRETFHNSAHYSFDHAKQSGNSTSTSSVWNDGYLEITTYAQNSTKQRADIKGYDTPFTLHAGNYPIIAVKIDDVKDLYDGVTARNFKPDFVGTVDGDDTKTEYKKFANEANNAYKSSYKCSDGSYVYVYDLTEQTFNSLSPAAYAPTDKSMSFKTFAFKYADIATATTQLTYKLYWIQTFKTKDDVKAYITNVDGLTYTVTKGE